MNDEEKLSESSPVFAEGPGQTVLPTCPHQWFEVKKLKRKRQVTSEQSGETYEFGERLGVLVKCANCLTSKELWE